MQKLDSDSFTALLQAAQQGDLRARNQLFALIDEDLRTTAARIVAARDRTGARPTSLVNEAYLRLFKEGAEQDLKCREYFFKAMLDQMHKVLIERHRRAARRPAQTPMDQLADMVLDDLEETLPFSYQDLRDATRRLKRSRNPKKARRHQLLELHLIAGMSVNEAARQLGISSSQAHEDKKLAEAELYLAIRSKSE